MIFFSKLNSFFTEIKQFFSHLPPWYAEMQTVVVLFFVIILYKNVDYYSRKASFFLFF